MMAAAAVLSAVKILSFLCFSRFIRKRLSRYTSQSCLPILKPHSAIRYHSDSWVGGKGRIASSAMYLSTATWPCIATSTSEGWIAGFGPHRPAILALSSSELAHPASVALTAAIAKTAGIWILNIDAPLGTAHVLAANDAGSQVSAGPFAGSEFAALSERMRRNAGPCAHPSSRTRM